MIRRFGQIFLTLMLAFEMTVGIFPASFAQAQLSTNTASPDVPTYQGVDQSIQQYLCTPEDSNLGDSLYICIRKVYRFGVAFGAIALVFFVVVAGYTYLTGGEASKAKGKSIFISALTGMVIILTSYVLLSFINPDLVKIKPIQAPIFVASNLPSCEEVGLGVACVLPDGQVSTPSGTVGYGTGKCAPITNDASPASVNNLAKSCFGRYGDTVVKQASIVASRESNGVPGLPVGAGACGNGRVARCTGGEIPVYGMFQINLTVHKVAGLNCPAAFQPNGGWTCSKSCTVINPSLYQQCVAAIKQPANDINVACDIYARNIAAGRPGWNDWGNKANAHALACGF